jgi:tRNA intron endonuclease, catalytic C-terminal domain
MSFLEKAEPWEDRIAKVRMHFQKKGYRVHSGLQFGCELVLYADDPSRVHSDFCVRLLPADGSIEWPAMQSLVRSMSDYKKTLIVVHLREDGRIDELALGSEHAPFRHRQKVAVGEQTKKHGGEKRKCDNASTSILVEGDKNTSHE